MGYVLTCCMVFHKALRHALWHLVAKDLRHSCKSWCKACKIKSIWQFLRGSPQAVSPTLPAADGQDFLDEGGGWSSERKRHENRRLTELPCQSLLDGLGGCMAFSSCKLFLWIYIYYIQSFFKTCLLTFGSRIASLHRSSRHASLTDYEEEVLE